MTIRNAAKALVVHDNKLLLVKYQGRMGEDCYTIPGGGQEYLETMEEAIARECLEETGYQVAVLDFVALYEEIVWDKAYQERHPDYAHKIFHIFLCRLRNTQPQKPTGEDAGQTGCEWVHLERVSSLNLYPLALRENIASLLREKGPVFLGTRKIPFAQ